ncbi:MAG: hypothetical protein Q8P25_05385, partial [Candidatus Curtissbacteria bacterium]|nr:hypothetical protein [Candidatus Curtissbacteria bacterium]
EQRMEGEVAIADAQIGDRRKVKELLVKKMKEERGNRYHHTKFSRKLRELISLIDDFGSPFHLPLPAWMDPRFNGEQNQASASS